MRRKLAGNGPSGRMRTRRSLLLETSLLAGGVSQQTHDSITAQIEAAAMNSAHAEARKQGQRARPRMQRVLRM